MYPIRVLEIPLDDGTKEYLATNLFDPAVTKKICSRNFTSTDGL